MYSILPSEAHENSDNSILENTSMIVLAQKIRCALNSTLSLPTGTEIYRFPPVFNFSCILSKHLKQASGSIVSPYLPKPKCSNEHNADKLLILSSSNSLNSVASSMIKRNPGTNHIPVVILTSSNDEESFQRCTECGADRYFTKPISMDLLRSVIANTLSNTDMIRNKYTNPIEYDYGEMQMPSSESRLPQRVVEVINAHIEDPDFSVEDLSREIGMSRVHMNRKLKEIIGMSPSNLIKSIRLKQAAYLLINDKVNISEVAYRVGFSTHSYFSSSFRDYFGMTPKEFVAKYIGCTDEETLKKIFG